MTQLMLVDSSLDTFPNVDLIYLPSDSELQMNFGAWESSLLVRYVRWILSSPSDLLYIFSAGSPPHLVPSSDERDSVFSYSVFDFITNVDLLYLSSRSDELRLRVCTSVEDLFSIFTLPLIDVIR